MQDFQNHPEPDGSERAKSDQQGIGTVLAGKVTYAGVEGERKGKRRREKEEREREEDAVGGRR